MIGVALQELGVEIGRPLPGAALLGLFGGVHSLLGRERFRRQGQGPNQQEDSGPSNRSVRLHGRWTPPALVVVAPAEMTADLVPEAAAPADALVVAGAGAFCR